MPANWRNRTLWTGDNLDIMRGMNSESVDLLYLDPPFNSNRDYAAPIGSEAAGAAFKDTWTLSDVDQAWHGEIADRAPALYAIIDAAGVAHGKGMKSYLIMMAVRLLEMKRLLKETGSIYLHCDPTASHYLKMLMDSIFGGGRFRNEIVWFYRRWPSKQKNFQRMHDIVLRYAKGDDVIWNQLFDPLSDETLKRIKGGKKIVTFHDEETGKKRIRATGEKSKGVPMRDVWEIKQIVGPSAERVGYPTQKPLVLLDRIIRASSNPGDMVLDPFCGCATALVAADRLDREWAGIDLSPLAARLVLKRLRDDRGPLFDDVHHREDVPARTDLGDLPNYRTHKHTLFGRQEGICAGCRVLFPFRNMTVDHVVPRAKGGQDNFDNLQLLCAACNSMKGARSQEEFVARLKAEGIRT
ncbi:MAG: DNA methyltransferase [Rhodospirillaceae bacterium]|nr:DNA methyltransferase [Rhodospirillaceae bacterium]